MCVCIHTHTHTHKYVNIRRVNYWYRASVFWTQFMVIYRRTHYTRTHVFQEEFAIPRENARLIYIDITRYPYLKLSDFRDNGARQMWGFLLYDVVYLFNLCTTRASPWVDSQGEAYGCECAMWSTWNVKDEFYVTSASSSCLINVFLWRRCLLDVKHRC
jgi:hypothetical protein